MAKTTISLNIPKSAAERAARSVLFDILGGYRVGDINHEQTAEAIEHWRTSINASLQGEDAVERVARIIIGPRLPIPDNCQFTLEELRSVRWSQSTKAEQQDALNAARAILATGLVADEAAIRADEREKCAKVAEAECYATTGRQIAAAIRSNGRGA